MELDSGSPCALRNEILLSLLNKNEELADLNALVSKIEEHLRELVPENLPHSSHKLLS